MELKDAFVLLAEGNSIQAKLTVGTETSTVNVP
ncbi:hypothetical protein QFZ76_000371 [Streptomyces sp. V4I2]|nr:hypothetical protein [Streptomyces sp. V4I2]